MIFTVSYHGQSVINLVWTPAHTIPTDHCAMQTHMIPIISSPSENKGDAFVYNFEILIQNLNLNQLKLTANIFNRNLDVDTVFVVFLNGH